MLDLCLVLISLLGTSLTIDLEGCGSEPKQINAQLEQRGDIYSPGYQEGKVYPDNLFCQYVITGPALSRIRLSFVDFDVEVMDLCQSDALEIQDVSSFSSPGIFCGNASYPDINTGSEVQLTFRSDYMVGRRGFHFKYHVSSFHDDCAIGEMKCRNRKCVSSHKKCDGTDDCGDGTDEENCGLVLPTTDCGSRKVKSDSSSSDRVVGGREAVPGSWPWQADLQISFVYPNGHMCGGTLINAQWVLSARHCFATNDLPANWRVHLGNHHKFITDEGEQIRMVEKIILYPKANDGKPKFPVTPDFIHDIALIKLNAPVRFTDQVRPICLSEPGDSPPVGKQCVATGWGMTRGTGSSHVLKEVDLWIESGANCHSLELGPMNNETMICTSNRKRFQDICHGDSGGPLVCEIDDKWYVMGATSYVTFINFLSGLCAMPGSNTVFSSVPSQRKWIDTMINKYS